MPVSLANRDHWLLLLFYNRKLALLFWFGLSVISVMHAMPGNGLNNFFIYKHVYLHLVSEQNLYSLYPQEYADVNLYGPFFSLVILPFSRLPNGAGAMAWATFNSLMLLLAVLQLPISEKHKTLLLFLCANELMIANGALQINPLICACILFGYSYVQKGKDAAALFFILAATFIKLYGVVGFTFFLFSKNRKQFFLWTAVWSLVFFSAPLIITSYSFLLQSYHDWANALSMKEAKNISVDASAIHQNISVMGIISRMFRIADFNPLWVLLPAAGLFVSQLIYFKRFGNLRYQLYILCSVLIATVIFSTGSENPTYIILLPALCIWYFLQPKSDTITVFFLAVFVFTTLAYSDLLTPWARRHLYHPLSLKALPPFVLWIVIVVQVHYKEFRDMKSQSNIPCKQKLPHHLHAA